MKNSGSYTRAITVLVQQSRQVFTHGSDTVKLEATFLVNLITVVVCVLKISLSLSTNFLFLSLEYLSVLIITKVLVTMCKIQVKKNPLKP